MKLTLTSTKLLRVYFKILLGTELGNFPSIHIIFHFQFPTMDEMTEGEKNFALKVEEFLSSVPKPEYRQLLVEVC